jgi:hypothetical protein
VEKADTTLYVSEQTSNKFVFCSAVLGPPGRDPAIAIDPEVSRRLWKSCWKTESILENGWPRYKLPTKRFKKETYSSWSSRVFKFRSETASEVVQKENSDADIVGP